MESTLKFNTELNPNAIQSVCLRGARRFEKLISLITPYYSYPTRDNSGERLSQKVFRFSDLKESHCLDNYDEEARTLDGLYKAMLEVYPDFESDEIVTLLQFKTHV